MNRMIRKTARALAISAAVLLLPAVAPVAGQVVVSQPAARDTVKAAPDYATEVLYDRWDMNERTDLGWTVFNIDEEPSPRLRDISFVNGIFGATTVLNPPTEANPTPTQSDAKIPILDSSYTGSAHIGKFGYNYLIDAGRYTHFLVRMYADPDVIAGHPAWSLGQLFWSDKTIYDGTLTWSNFFSVSGGWVFYEVDIPALGVLGGANDPWTGTKGSLRFDPTVLPDLDIAIDWIRLVNNDAACRKTIAWTGATTVDIYLDDDANAANGNLGLLKKNAAGTSYEFLAGGLAAGNYYVALTTDNGASFSYSAGYYEVTEQPIVVFTKPSAEGSDQDFASLDLEDPWDFDALSDIDLANKVNSQEIKTGFTYEDLAGNVYTNNTVYYAKADIPASGVGDPQVFLLSAAPAYRGYNHPIDYTRYHNLVARMGIYGNHSTAGGSIARVIYMRKDKHLAGECVSQDIVIRHKTGPNPVMHKIVADLKMLPLETNTATYGWTGMIDSFRIDPHEFADGRAFFYDDVKITADWRADATFTIEWTDDAPAGATMSLYRDVDRDYNGTLIAANVPVSDGSYVWDTSGVAGGVYNIFAVITSGADTNRVYSIGPVIIDHSIPPQIGLSRTSLNFTKIKGGKLTPVEKVELKNLGDGTLAWTAAKSANWISVLPKSGTGDKILNIKIVNVFSLPVGTYSGTVTVACPGASNSPQTITVNLIVKAPRTDALPFGEFDFPAGETATFGASIGLGGWALDDVAMQAVKIFRRLTPTTRKLIEKAVFVAGARPGIETNYSTYPQNYKAGWTYTLRNTQLPNAGVGVYTIEAYAFDTTGRKVLLGTKTLTGTGATALAAAETPDEPADGATVSGSVRIAAPGKSASSGKAPAVWLDGLALRHSEYDGLLASAAFDLDTTVLTEGWHTLAWNADGGETGSRYVRVKNDAAADEGEEEIEEEASPVVANPIKAARLFEEIGAIPEDVWSAVYVKRGFVEESSPERVFPEAGGAVRIDMAPASRLAVYLGADEAFEGEAAGKARIQRILKDAKNPPEFRRFDAYALVGERLRDLPIGASFDGRAGILYWQPGPGFVGEHVFVVVTNDGARPTRKTVKVTILPR